MNRRPKRIAAKVQLRNGDSIPAMAFRGGRNENGLVQYVISYEDGSPLEIDAASVEGFSMVVLPARSSVRLDIRVD